MSFAGENGKVFKIRFNFVYLGFISISMYVLVGRNINKT